MSFGNWAKLLGFRSQTAQKRYGPSSMEPCPETALGRAFSNQGRANGRATGVMAPP